jgi:hypothetical protein
MRSQGNFWSFTAETPSALVKRKKSGDEPQPIPWLLTILVTRTYQPNT